MHRILKALKGIPAKHYYKLTINFISIQHICVPWLDGMPRVRMLFFSFGSASPVHGTHEFSTEIRFWQSIEATAYGNNHGIE